MKRRMIEVHSPAALFPALLAGCNGSGRQDIGGSSSVVS